MLTANRRGLEFRATNGELVKVKSLDGGAIHLEDGRTLPANYHEFTHGYAVTAHRSQGKTVDTVIISADAMKKELFYVAASRGRTEIAVVTSDREQLRESVGVSTMRQSAMELARKQLTSHSSEKGHRVDLVTDVNRQAGQQIGEQHSSVPDSCTGTGKDSPCRPRPRPRWSRSWSWALRPLLRPHLHISHMAEKWAGGKGLCQGRALCAAKRS